MGFNPDSVCQYSQRGVMKGIWHMLQSGPREKGVGIHEEGRKETSRALECTEA